MRAIRSPTAEQNERVARAESLMRAFAERTGLTSSRPSRRYLWTDAFAVCNFLGLARATGEERHRQLALALVDAVHRVLGRHRDDDPRRGWLSGLPEAEGAKHPTAGGLRIGKDLPERGPHEPYAPRLEWDRDGQYFHYLTKWMHALDQVARHTGEARFNHWARELARVAHDAFLQRPRGRGAQGSGIGVLYWKMSIDLSRPLVASTSPHDPLDGFVTTRQLQDTASLLPNAPTHPNLEREAKSLARAIDLRALGTTDPLSLGGLLVDACRLAQLLASKARPTPELASLLRVVVASTEEGLGRIDAGMELRRPAERRLGFRELGLAIGLEGLASMGTTDGDAELAWLLERLGRYGPLARAIETYWSAPAHQAAASWLSHRDINEVMLATSLLPSGLLELPGTPPEVRPA